jgi:YD repeat-containing protein
MEKHRWMSSAVLVAAFAPAVGAQSLMSLIGPIPPESVGLPPQPPFITFIGVGNPGKLATDPSIPPKVGAVAQVFYEELRGIATRAGPEGGVEASVLTKYDGEGRVTERVEKRWGSETDTLYRYQDGRLVSMESTFPDSNKSRPKAWNHWTYNSRGKLMEFRRGSGTEIQNHFLGFRYDDKGRLLAFEYRQGRDDKPFSRTEIGYSDDGRTVVAVESFAESNTSKRSTLILDTQGRVVRVILGNDGRFTREQAHEIVFRYDDQGRLLEQTTDAVKFSDVGAENDLPPGRISIAYDDKARTRTTTYTVPNEGTLEVVVTEDDSGATVGYTLQGRDAMKLDCEYDRAGNWSSCREIVEGNGPRFVKQEFRRTITYR